ncbi:MAG: autotransporter-associated beta strand repeat-containing protein, partial [Alphaproteobacteria bacterium]|nr:autotransporter-associated beta strand repeat-containing protein [Alphaproteobacteria bacterium]
MKKLLGITLTIVAPMSAATPALSQTVWTGGTDTNFSTDANWSPATAPGALDSAVVNNGALGNQPVVSSASMIDQLDVSAGSVTLSNANLTASTRILLSGSGMLSGSVGSQFLTDTFKQTGGTVSNGTIINAGSLDLQSGSFLGEVAGSADVVKNGAGTLIWRAQWATNPSGLFVNAGTFQLEGGTGTHDWNVAAGATVDLRNTGAPGSTQSHSVGALSGAGTVTSNGAGATTLAMGAGTGTFSGVLQDGASVLNVSKAGTGTQTLSGTNTFTGSLNISQGTIEISNAQALGSTAGYTAVSGTGGLTLANVAVSAEQLYLGGTLTGTGS